MPDPEDGPIVHTYVSVFRGYQERGATAFDSVSGDLTSRIRITGSVPPRRLGTFRITYTVTDDAGNEARAYRDVHVTLTGR